jgi:hypothetical protein
MVEQGMVVLLVLTSPDALSEPLEAGARPVHSIRDQSRRRNSLVVIGGIADIGMRWSRKARLRLTQLRHGQFRILTAQMDHCPPFRLSQIPALIMVRVTVREPF